MTNKSNFRGKNRVRKHIIKNSIKERPGPWKIKNPAYPELYHIDGTTESFRCHFQECRDALEEYWAHLPSRQSQKLISEATDIAIHGPDKAKPQKIAEQLKELYEKSGGDYHKAMEIARVEQDPPPAKVVAAALWSQWNR